MARRRSRSGTRGSGPVSCVGTSVCGRATRASDMRKIVPADPKRGINVATDELKKWVADPTRMYLVLRRGAVASLARAGELAGAAAVACVREFADSPAMAEWRPRRGKVCLRARNDSQWRQVLAEPHVLAGAVDGEAVAALPP